MEEKKGSVNAQSLSNIVVKGMQERKAQDIVMLNMQKVKNSIADFFVICTGTSDTHVDAISESIEKEVHVNARQNPWHKEGKQNKEWILLDYVDVVVHIFKADSRSFYSLEDLWGDAQLIEVDYEYN